MRPSGLTRNSPSYPVDPAKKPLVETPDSAHFGAASFRARDALFPLELLRAAIERLFQERAGRMRPLAVPCGAPRRLPFGTIDPTNVDLIERELAALPWRGPVPS